jgi:Domain of unknown function (DUF362)
MNSDHRHNRPLTRRRFLAGAAVALGGSALALAQRLGSLPAVHGQDPTPAAVLPLVARTSRLPRVVHIHDAAATNWDGSGHFYDAVDQDVVNAMVQAGLQHLTGHDAWPDIWTTLFTRIHPGGYSPGQKIAVKVNFNNSGTGSNGCSSHNNVIDALPQPVLALLHGLVAAGVEPGDVTIYDASYTGLGRIIPDYFRNPIIADYPTVNYIGQSVCPGVVTPSHGKDPSLTVPFHPPVGSLTDRYLADILYDATYLINVPILKRHGGDDYNPVTLGFKNHFGSIDQIGRGSGDDLHPYITTTDPSYRTTYSPFVDIYSNPNIKDKTVLTLGDGLYGAFGPGSPVPISWATFGDAPNSLFFATDPVAVDCVMADLLVAEGVVSKAHTYDFLFCAAEAGLGICEGTRADPGGDPWQLPYGTGYANIQYTRIDSGPLSLVGRPLYSATQRAAGDFCPRKSG